jgi:hypothetical protein
MILRLFGLFRFVIDVLWALVRDFRALRARAMCNLFYERAARSKKTVNSFFQENLKKTPHKIAIEFYDKKWTFNDVSLTNMKRGF